jgi:Transposase zinc-binding domain/Phage integrase, N-terminal SAM-like domain
MQQDMMMRGLLPRTQEQYIRHVRRFASFLGRPPDTATPEDLRSFQVHQHEKGASAATINGAVSALRFLYTVTLRHRALARSLIATRRPHKIREVLSVEEAARLLEAAPGLKYKAALGVAYNSCHNRHCPKCQGAAARTWLAEREADLLPVGYFHVVFTLPSEVADIAFQNKAVIYDLLFKATSENEEAQPARGAGEHRMMTIAGDPTHLGARIGITAVLHT